MPLSSARSKQRKHALRILFEIDINKTSIDEVLEGKRMSGEQIPGEFAVSLARGVLEKRDFIDGVISEYSEGWEISRMPVVDRNILRMALFEIFFCEDVPVGACINEAVELAKVFSTEDSGKFINGMLGRIYRDVESGKISLP